MKLTNIFSYSLLLLALVACSTSSDDESIELKDPKLLFEEGMSELADDNLEKAAKVFETIEREHPATIYATEAEVRRAYTLYLDGKYDEAIMSIDDFINQYPAYKSTPYMYYLKGLCYFEQIVDIGRDQQLSEKAAEAFEEVMMRFTDTTYARDAKLKREYAISSIAGKEIAVGKFYLSKSNYLAALNRFKTVVDKYQQTIFIEEALYRITEVYYHLGDAEQAAKYASVLGYNYPDSQWYKDAYQLLNTGQPNNQKWNEKIKKIW